MHIFAYNLHTRTAYPGELGRIVWENFRTRKSNAARYFKSEISFLYDGHARTKAVGSVTSEGTILQCFYSIFLFDIDVRVRIMNVFSQSDNFSHLLVRACIGRPEKWRVLLLLYCCWDLNLFPVYRDRPHILSGYCNNVFLEKPATI